LSYFGLTRLFSANMKNPGFNPKMIWLVCAAFAALAVTVLAQPPDIIAKKAPARSRPQVIYHLPPASSSAATLHSQAKGRNSDLPADSDMPTSLSHGKANEAAAAAQQQQTPTPQPQQPALNTRVQSNPSQARPRSSGKSSGHGNSQGHKSHKK
jgi:hypothetical protein